MLISFRIFFIVLSVFAGFSVMIGLFGMAGWGIAYWFGAVAPDTASGIGTAGIALLGHLQPYLANLMWVATGASAATLLLTGVLYLALPRSWRLRHLFPMVSISQLPPGHALELPIRDIARTARIRKPVLLIADSAHPWAIPITGVGHATLIVTRGALARLDVMQTRWLFAHLMAHVQNLDATVNTYWASLMWLLDTLLNTHLRVRYLLLTMFHALNMTSILGAIFLAPVALGLWATKSLRWIIRGTFLLCDRWIVNRIEAAADEIACSETEPAAGLEVLALFDGHIEPAHPIFTCHSDLHRRLEEFISRVALTRAQS